MSTNQPASAPAYLRPWTWPRWVKFLLFVPVVAGLTFYYRDVRVGDGYWGKKPEEISSGIKARVDNYGRVKVVYQDQSELPADGLCIVVVTKEDHAKSPERLAAYKSLIGDDDWPAVVFLNATGFDATGEPICIRRAADGKELFATTGKRVAFNYPNRDGSFTVYHSDGTNEKVSEEDWIKKYMRLPFQPVPDAKELEKLSDEELKKRGYERIPAEEAKKRGLVDEEGKPLPFPRPRPPVFQEKTKEKTQEKK